MEVKAHRVREGDEPACRAATQRLDFRAAGGLVEAMRLMVNGRPQEVDATPGETLLVTLRERLALTGAKAGCERGECGACTVHLDGRAVYSCLVFTHGVGDRAVTTIEGVSPPDGPLDRVQEAFVACDAVQCGYCTPGQVMAATALLARHPVPTDAEIDVAMSGNLCRCGTYPKIRAAIHRAATAPGAR